MVNFEKTILSNGLRVIVHEDKSTPLAAVNLLYDIGAKDENPDKTGFAHLFEHLMFGGSDNIPSFDNALQQVGGDNNAFTNNDLTNYYLTLPANNLETAFWLESDRMLRLAFSEKSLEVQRNVVIEEFKQRYLNQPYGDVWLMLSPLAYKVHPYRWSTIGISTDHIAGATMQDVKDFFYKFYAPNNCILVVAGNVKFDKVVRLAEKWFGSIEKRNVPVRNLSMEPKQTEKRFLEVERKVPASAFYKVFHTCGKNDASYHTTDLISDILSNGKSSRLYNKLVKGSGLFSELEAYISGNIHPGLIIISGKIYDNVSLEQAEAAVMKEIDLLKNIKIDDYELQKVKNKVESNLAYGELSFLNKAMNLAFHELLGDANGINKEVEKYRQLTSEDIINTARDFFKEENSSTLFYKAIK